MTGLKGRLAATTAAAALFLAGSLVFAAPAAQAQGTGMSGSGRSAECGPCQLPQHRWYRICSSGMLRSAWFSASQRIWQNFR